MSDQANLLSALLAVQAEAPTLPKDATNPHYQSKFTPLDTIVETIGPILNKHGLVWTSWPTTDEHGQPALSYQLSHVPTGETKEGTMLLLLTKSDPQGQGSAITYARRYSLCAVLNLVADDDDDGHAAGAGGNGADRFTAPTAPQLKYLRSLITQSRAPKQTLRAMLDTVQAQDVEITDGWTGRLGREQVSRLIELFKAGSLPDPEAIDVPADDAPEVPPVGDDTDLPFAARPNPMPTEPPADFAISEKPEPAA